MVARELPPTIATPECYGKPDGTIFGTIALTEVTETVLPKLPQNHSWIDGKEVSEWKMVILHFLSCSYFLVVLYCQSCVG